MIRSGLIGSVGGVMEPRPWRQVYVQALQLDDGDVERLAGLEAQRGVEAEVVETDERSASVGGYGDALDLSRRPDAQAAPLSAQAVDQRHVKAVEFHAGVKPGLESVHDAGAQEWLGAVQHPGRDAGKSGEQYGESNQRTLQNAVPAPERCINLPQDTPPIGFRCACPRPEPFSD